MVDFNVPWFDVYDQHGQMRSLCCLEKQCKEMVRSEGRYMELKRIDKNNIPFSLHDSRIVKIEIVSDELIFYLDNVYEYSGDSEEYYPAIMTFRDVDLEECSIMVFDKQAVKGDFAGVRYGIDEFKAGFAGAEFEIITEAYGGYSTILEGLIWKDGSDPVSGIINIWTMGDIVFSFEKPGR